MSLAGLLVLVAALILWRRRPRCSLALAAFVVGWVLMPAPAPTAAGGRPVVRVVVVGSTPSHHARPAGEALEHDKQTGTAKAEACKTPSD